jgi:hypothetical protein
MPIAEIAFDPELFGVACEHRLMTYPWDERTIRTVPPEAISLWKGHRRLDCWAAVSVFRTVMLLVSVLWILLLQMVSQDLWAKWLVGAAPID